MSERDNAGDDTDLAGERRPRAAAQLSGKAGILPRQDIRNLVHRKVLQAKADFDPGQFQPASLDLRLGAKAFRVRASFLPGAGMTVAQKLADLKSDEIDLEHGAVLERGCVYVVELLENLKCRRASPRWRTRRARPGASTSSRGSSPTAATSSTACRGYDGPLYAEVSPRSFSVKGSGAARG